MQRREPLNDKLIIQINKGVKSQALILADREEISLSQLVRRLIKNHIDENSSIKRKLKNKKSV